MYFDANLDRGADKQSKTTNLEDCTVLALIPSQNLFIFSLFLVPTKIFAWDQDESLD